MAYDFDGSTQYLRLGSAPVTAVPLTMACWFNTDDATVGQRLLVLSKETDATSTGFMLVAAGNIVGDPVRAQVFNAGASDTAQTSSGYTTGVWHHACGVFSASNSRTAYLDGGSSGSGTASLTPAAPTAVNIGAHVRSGDVVTFTNGRVAEPAIWNVALTTAEIAALAKGVSPMKIRPQSLVFYPPLIRELVELKGGVSLTATGSPTVAAHPRVYGL